MGIEDYPSRRHTPFTLADAQVVIYEAGADHEPLNLEAPEYLGPQCHVVQDEEQANRRRRFASGAPFSDSSLEDFETRLTIRSEWLHESRLSDESVDVSRVPRLGLRQRYVILVIWFSRHKRAYVKRTYFNCKLASQAVEPDGGRYRAAFTFTSSWSQDEVKTSQPDHTAKMAGEIRYSVGGYNPVLVYSYILGSGTLTQHIDTADLNTHLKVTQTVGGAYGGWELRIHNVLVARWYEDTGEQIFECAKFVEGMARGSDKGRAEFWIGNWRAMVVDEDAVVYAPQLWEGGQPGGAAAFGWWFLHAGTAASEVRLREVLT